MKCRQELCLNWSGDGNVCPCAVFYREVSEMPDLRGSHFGRDLRDIDEVLDGLHKPSD